MGMAAVQRQVGSGASRRAARRRERTLRKWKRIGIGAGGVVLVGLAIGGLAAVASGGEETSGSGVAPVEVSLGDFFIAGDLTVPAGEVRLRATNVGVEPHDVGIRGGRISTTVFSGGSAEVDLGELAPGTYELYCDISDHVARGMVATLTVTEPAKL